MEVSQMTTVKTRKVGNSTTITLPKELDVKIGIEFTAYRGVDGVIVLAPKIENPLDKLEPFRMEDEFEDVEWLDSEIS